MNAVRMLVWVGGVGLVTWDGMAADQTLKVYFGNLHSHTSYSDGSGKPTDAYKYARTRVDFLAITEHNHKGAEKSLPNGHPRKDGIMIAKDHSLYNGSASSSLISAAKKYNKDGEFVALYGQEFSTIEKSGNHVNVYEIWDVIDETVVTNGGFGQLVTWLETHRDSENKPAIIQFNHPSEDIRERKIEYGLDDFPNATEWIKALSKHACLIEAWNGPGTTTSGDFKPDVFTNDYIYYLNLGFKLAPTANQDNHYKDWGDRTVARTGVIATSKTKANILDALRKRHVYATLDPTLNLFFWVNDRLCGDVINTLPAAGSELKIEFVINDTDEDADYEIEVYSDKPGGAVAKMVEKISTSGNTPTPTPQKIQDVPFTGAGQYLFFVVRQLDGDGKADMAITAPVWFEAAGAPPVIAGPVPSGLDESKFVASVNSDFYHVSDQCISAKAIKPANKITGPAAAQGNTQHPNCPIISN